MSDYFERQINNIVRDIRVVNKEYIYLLSDGSITYEHQNQRIVDIVNAFGMSVDEDPDVRLLLALYIYATYYVWPSKELIQYRKAGILKQSVRAKQSSGRDDAVFIDNATYEDVTGLRIDYWIDAHWNYTKPEVDHEYSATQVLRKGSEGQWVSSGTYVETSVITSDDNPSLSIHQRTHEFAIDSQRGYYNWIYGKYLSDNNNRGGVRFYFHLTPFRNSVALLAREIQKGFDLYEIPFTFKFLTFNVDYQYRSDTSVLYVSRKHLHIATQLLADIYALFQNDSFNHFDPESTLGTETPQLAYPLAPGVAFGENPGNNDSFGINRCKLIAEALINSDFESFAARSNSVKDFIKDQGYVIDEFYKNPLSIANYDFLFELFKPFGENKIASQQRLDNKGLSTTTTKPLNWNGYRRKKFTLTDEAEWFGQPGVYRRKYLIAAVRIAIRLCKEAVWYLKPSDSSGQLTWMCNWLSYQPISSQEQNGNGYSYQLLSTVADEETGTIGVRGFIEYIYGEYYNAEVLKLTYAGADVANSQTFFDSGEPNWNDEDISIAWDYLYERISLSREQAERLANFIIERFFDAGRPLGNGFMTDDPSRKKLFCANKKFGLVGLGLFFLKVYEL